MNRESVILTADIVVTYNNHVLLIHRAKPPFENKLVLPGGHVESNETMLEAAVRELREETCLIVDPSELHFLIYLDQLGRDPRPGRRVSFVFQIDLTVDDPRLETICASDDARELIWRDLASLSENEIGFDHFKAIRLVK